MIKTMDDLTNTQSDVKQRCIEYLENLLENVKNDTISDNYSFTVEKIESETIPTGEVNRVRYSLERNEYKIID